MNWPSGFKPTGIEKYDGKTDPESWLTVYTLAIRAGGDSKAMANYLPVASTYSIRNWLARLQRGSISSWSELHDHYIANFQSSFEQPGTHFELLKDYIQRFFEKPNKISDITDDNIIAALTSGVRNDLLTGKFGRKPPKIVKQLFKKANEYTKLDDVIKASKQSASGWRPKKDNDNGAGARESSNGQKDRKRKPEDLVLLHQVINSSDPASTPITRSRTTPFCIIQIPNM